MSSSSSDERIRGTTGDEHEVRMAVAEQKVVQLPNRLFAVSSDPMISFLVDDPHPEAVQERFGPRVAFGELTLQVPFAKSTITLKVQIDNVSVAYLRLASCGPHVIRREDGSPNVEYFRIYAAPQSFDEFAQAWLGTHSS